MASEKDVKRAQLGFGGDGSRWDVNQLAEQFAVVRAEERAAIVAWLRKGRWGGQAEEYLVGDIVDGIESGEYEERK